MTLTKARPAERLYEELGLNKREAKEQAHSRPGSPARARPIPQPQ